MGRKIIQRDYNHTVLRRRLYQYTRLYTCVQLLVIYFRNRRERQGCTYYESGTVIVPLGSVKIKRAESLDIKLDGNSTLDCQLVDRTTQVETTQTRAHVEESKSRRPSIGLLDKN